LVKVVRPVVCLGVRLFSKRGQRGTRKKKKKNPPAAPDPKKEKSFWRGEERVFDIGRLKETGGRKGGKVCLGLWGIGRSPARRQNGRRGYWERPRRQRKNKIQIGGVKGSDGRKGSSQRGQKGGFFTFKEKGAVAETVAGQVMGGERH